MWDPGGYLMLLPKGSLCFRKTICLPLLTGVREVRNTLRCDNTLRSSLGTDRKKKFYLVSRIWIIKHKSSRELKFRHDEMFEGAGRSMMEWLMTLISGCFFRMIVIRC